MLRKSLLLAFAVILIVTGCRSSNDKAPTKDQTAYEKIQVQLLSMESYRSEAKVEYISNKGTNSYETFQLCKITGEYRIEVVAPENVAGNVTMSDGTTIYQFNPKISGKIAMGTKESQERSEVFITSFLKNYLKSQEVSISVASLGAGQCTVLEASIPGDHPYLTSEKLWVDNTTLMPVKLVVYDPDGAERIVVTYKNFEYNVTLEDANFKI